MAVGSLIDEDEDPEERRRWIEAEENASNLGAMLGLAIAAAEALTEDEPRLTM